MSDFEVIKNAYKNDYIYIKGKKIRPFSITWWAIRVGEATLWAGALVGVVIGLGILL